MIARIAIGLFPASLLGNLAPIELTRPEHLTQERFNVKNHHLVQRANKKPAEAGFFIASQKPISRFSDPVRRVRNAGTYLPERPV